VTAANVVPRIDEEVQRERRRQPARLSGAGARGHQDDGRCRRAGVRRDSGVTAVMAPPRRPARTPVVPAGRPAQTDAAVRTGAAVLLWSSLALVSYWWAAGGGVQDLSGWDSGLTSLGRLTGLAAADLLLV
jgi:hypothetical protein